ncbi:hypothetical protein [Sorangium sp. So ce176]|uniref:hypothetical protein n=1 Tax=Sorangium sp. So ce176 TaxID=3133286 RepID=UPI003F62E571
MGGGRLACWPGLSRAGVRDPTAQSREKLPKAEADRLVEDLTGRSAAVQEILLQIDRARGISLAAVKRTAEQRLGELDQALKQARQRD